MDTFYKDHWVHIDSERLKGYDKLFNLPEAAMKALVAPLEIQPGHVALDLGCGPGFVAAGMAKMVGESGHVHGVDVNADFCARANQVASEQGVKARVSIHHVNSEKIPLPDGSVDRSVAKNVLEYVPSMQDSLAELFRVSKPGGKVLALDSDWGFLVVEPWTADEVREVFGAAAPAFKEPFIGRKLRGAFAAAGFTDVKVEIRANPDTAGALRGVCQNMLNYGLKFGTLSEARAKELGGKLDEAIKKGTFMMILPQFVVTGVKPGHVAAKH